MQLLIGLPVKVLGKLGEQSSANGNVFSSFKDEIVDIPNQYNMSCRIDKYRLTKVGRAKGGWLFILNPDAQLAFTDIP